MTRANGQKELLLRLIAANGQTLYTFPALELAQERDILAVNAVSFKDVDGDGKKDVIVIADYSSPKDQSDIDGITIPIIYIQADKDFFYSFFENLGKVKTISDILPILKQESNQNIIVKDKINYSLCKRVRALELSEEDVVKIYTDEY